MDFRHLVPGFIARKGQPDSQRIADVTEDHAVQKTVGMCRSEAARKIAGRVVVPSDEVGSRGLMVYHELYRAWSWTGGHADGDPDLLAVAEKEAMEETGLPTVRPIVPELFSLELLSVAAHVKRGRHVSAHLHLNLTYLLEADLSLHSVRKLKYRFDYAGHRMELDVYPFAKDRAVLFVYGWSPSSCRRRSRSSAT